MHAVSFSQNRASKYERKARELFLVQKQSSLNRWARLLTYRFFVWFLEPCTIIIKLKNCITKELRLNHLLKHRYSVNYLSELTTDSYQKLPHAGLLIVDFAKLWWWSQNNPPLPYPEENASKQWMISQYKIEIKNLFNSASTIEFFSYCDFYLFSNANFTTLVSIFIHLHLCSQE